MYASHLAQKRVTERGNFAEVRERDISSDALQWSQLGPVRFHRVLAKALSVEHCIAQIESALKDGLHCRLAAISSSAVDALWARRAFLHAGKIGAIPIMELGVVIRDLSFSQLAASVLCLAHREDIHLEVRHSDRVEGPKNKKVDENVQH